MVSSALVLAITSLCVTPAFCTSTDEADRAQSGFLARRVDAVRDEEALELSMRRGAKAVDELLAAGLDPNGMGELIKDPQTVLHSPRWCRYLDQNGQCALSCASGGSFLAQQGKYWMPCGAIAAAWPSFGQQKQHASLCRREELLSSEAECREAAQQFQEEWNGKQKSGFPETDASSEFKYHWKTHEYGDAYRQPEHGAQPYFRGFKTGHMDSKKPIGCSLDKNQNVIYWNEYKQTEPNEWTAGATYTDLGGLIHRDQAVEQAWHAQTKVGICKSAQTEYV